MTAAPHAHLLRRLYQDTAPRYAADIAPALARLAASALNDLPLGGGDTVLDLGAGTGVAARLVAPRVRAAVGVDISTPMLAAGRARAAGVAFVGGDAHALPFAPATFDVIIATFCLNETRPDAALAEVRRVLRPGGRLALLEWGPPDPLTRRVDEIIAAYAVEEAGDFLAGMRELAAWWRPWDEAVEDCADIADLLRAAGFRAVACEAVVGRAPFARAEDFIRYALAWSPRRAEVDAMPAPARAQCIAALRAELGAGALTWAPPLFRASARR